MNKISAISFIIFLFTTFSYSQWIPQTSGTTNLLSNVFFADQNIGNVVGSAGTIRRTTNGGQNWTAQQNTPNEDFYGIFFVNPSTGYLCGDAGRISKTVNGGQNWTILSPPVELYRKLYFLNEDTGFACGSGGLIIKTTDGGANWVQQTTGTTQFLQNVKFADASTGYSAGLGGVVIKTTNGGSNWSVLSTGITDLLFGLAVTSQQIVYASGESGRIIKTTNGGANWVSQTSGAADRIVDLFFSNANTGSGVGLSNIIIRTTNGGASWISQPSGLSGQDFFGVYFTSGSTGYVVGSNGNILTTTTGGFPVPGAPNLVFPSNAANGVSLTPLMNWDSVAAAKTYQIQIATDSTFTSMTLDSSLIVPTQLQIPSGTLNNNVLYFWRVRGQNAGGNGVFSNIFRFRTIVALPNAPNLLLPLNGATNVSLTPNFDWDSTSPADFYRLQIALDTGFVSLQVNVTGITQSSYSLTNPQLQNNFRYYWRVNATNQAGTGPWSNVFSFTTITGFPPAPVLLSPPNNSTGISLTPTLNWVDDITATNYQLQLSQDSTLTSTIIDSTGFNVSQLVVRSGLLTNITSYFWRVRTTNNLGTGPWSAVWKFTTVLAPPASPILLDPPNGATNVSTTPTLDWNDVPFAATYRIQVSTDSTFGSFLINLSPLTFSQYNVPGGILQNNTTYYWRVNATNSAGTGPFSQVWRFRTVVTPPVAAPDLISPPNGANNLSLTPTLDWNDVFGANGYRVNVSNDSLFNTTIIDTTLTPSQYTVLAGRLSGGVTYFWRVRAFNVGGFGPWSVTWRFRTFPIGIIIISTNTPNEFKLHNNYPNPFNPITKIRFDIAKQTKAKLEIFDILGRKADELVNSDLQPGTYEASWNAANLSSGIYFYRLATDEFIDIKKMILVK